VGEHRDPGAVARRRSQKQVLPTIGGSGFTIAGPEVGGSPPGYVGNVSNRSPHCAVRPVPSQYSDPHLQSNADRFLSPGGFLNRLIDIGRD
jgi:hypothetical protein